VYDVKHMARVACDTYGEVALLGGLVVVVKPSLGERGLGRWRSGERNLGNGERARRRARAGWARPAWTSERCRRGMASGGPGKCTLGLETTDFFPMVIRSFPCALGGEKTSFLC
jgi:hypothetical protein